MLSLLFVSLCTSLVRAQEEHQQFLATPSDVTVSPGTRLTLPCLVENKGGECRWEKDGVPVGLFPEKYRMEGEEGDCSLEVLDAMLEWDDGWWECQVSASDPVLADSLISPRARLSVLTPPAGLQILEARCEVELASPPPVIQVRLEDSLVPTTQQDERLETGGWRSGVSLSQLMRPENNGKTVTCVAEQEGEVVVETSVLDIPFPPEILGVQTDKEFYRPGDSALLTCRVRSNPPASVSWRRGQERLEGTGEGSLVIIQVDLSTASHHYYCTADNDLGQAVSSPVTLTLARPPVLLPSSLPSHLVLNTGQTLAASCQAESLPPVEYMWLRRSGSGEVTVVSQEAELRLEEVDFPSAGEYLCEASNLLGKTLGDVINVDIKGRPKLSKAASHHSVELGKSFQTEIEFCANPAPDIILLLKDEELISSLSGVAISDGNSKSPDHCYLSVVSFNSVERSHSGQYRIVLGNTLGNDTGVLQLEVEAEEMEAGECLIAAGVGIVLGVVLVIISVILCSLRQRRQASKQAASIGTSTSEVDSEKGERGESSCEDLVKENSDPVSSKPAYSQLLYPKSSNCGSMKRKKEEHYKNMMTIYNTAIKHNLSSIYDTNYRGRNLYL